MWYQVVVILGLMMVRTALADDELGWVVPHQSNQETLRIVREECQDEEFLDTKVGKLLCTAARAFPIPTTPSSSTTSPTTEMMAVTGLVTGGQREMVDQQRIDNEHLHAVKELCKNTAFISTKKGKQFCSPGKIVPTPSTPSSSTTSSTTTEIIPNKPMTTTADTGATDLSSPTATSGPVNRHSSKGDSSTITWACIGTGFAVIVLVAVGFFIRRYTKRAGSHHSIQIRYRKMSPQP